MIRGLAKLVLLRYLPRRLIPLLTVWEIYRVVRGLQHPKPELEVTTETTTEVTTRRRGTRRPPPP